MPTYVFTSKWTDQGAKNVRGAVDRAGQTGAAVDKAGGQVVGLWWTQGQYDAVAVIEWPDNEAASLVALLSAAAGNVRGETMRAYTNDEMQRILQKLP